MPDEVAGKIISMLAAIKHVPAEGITLDSSLQEMGIDSLDTFTLLFDLENEFHITIPDDEAKSIRTVDEIEEDERMRQRMRIIREFIEAKGRKAGRAGKN